VAPSWFTSAADVLAPSCLCQNVQWNNMFGAIYFEAEQQNFGSM
jgi:hypothetical protein